MIGLCSNLEWGYNFESKLMKISIRDKVVMEILKSNDIKASKFEVSQLLYDFYSMQALTTRLSPSPIF